QGGGRGRKRLGKGLVHSTVSSPSRPRPVGETVRKGDTPRGGGGCWRRCSPPGIMLRAARCPVGVSPWGVEPRAPGAAGPRTPCRRRRGGGRVLQHPVPAAPRGPSCPPGPPQSREPPPRPVRTATPDIKKNRSDDCKKNRPLPGLSPPPAAPAAPGL